MYVHGSRKDGGLLSGWIKDGSLDLFLWFDGDVLTKAQITSDQVMAEWTPPSKLLTGRVREGPRGFDISSEVVDLDHQTQQAQVDAVRDAIAASALDPEVMTLALSVLNRESPPDHGAAVAAMVREALEKAAPA